ncbi:MAG: TlpA disulfide reductase family protein [candidate division KSB1 bacterium]|jgi:peroxiredoxin|nr:TlpA disulfide reductase family protein [candidate division KSB1 bacterium]
MKRLIILLLLIPVFAAGQDLSKIELHTLNGKKFNMNKNLDHDATVVLFWATWCLPCKKEFPAVQKLIEKFKDKDIQVLAVSTDSPRSQAKVKSFARMQKYDFTYLMDLKGEVTTKLLIKSVPHTLLLDRSGKVIYTHRGYRLGDEVELEKALMKMWDNRPVTSGDVTE